MLYKSIRLINYKAFDDITFSLISKNNTPKNIAIIYGANGSGKSTILESFATLHDLTHTMDITNTLDILKEKLNHPIHKPIQILHIEFQSKAIFQIH